MAISAQVFTPYFAAEVPAQNFSFNIRSLSGGGVFPVTWNYTGGLYYCRGGGIFADFGTGLAAALNAYAVSGPGAAFGAAFGFWTWVVTGASNSIGFSAYLKCTLDEFEFTTGADLVKYLGIELLADAIPLPAPSTDWALYASRFPAATWFPQVRANDLGLLPSPAQVSYSPLTADGSIAVVNMSPSPATLPVWWTLYLDGTIGVHGARMQYYRTAKPAWAAAIGVATGAPYCALDYPGGWWSLAVLGVPFIIGDQAVAGEYVGALRIHAGPECPEGMDPIRGLRAPTVSITGAAGGRRDLRLAFLYSGGLFGGSPY
jgi:hypothetical protein